MFKNWQLEKAVQALIDEAQAVADRLGSGKAHVIESYAAYAQVWAVTFHVAGQDVQDLAAWKPAEVKRFISATQTKIAALRKQRLYDSSDGLAVWLHTARAVSEPRIEPAVAEIWRLLQSGGSNAVSMTEDLLDDAGLPKEHKQFAPKRFLIS
jgi:hypothetical protein